MSEPSPRGAAVVLGAGVVSPAGSTLEALWNDVSTADATAARVVTFEQYGGVTALACTAAGFHPEERLERHELRRLDRSHQMAFWAADDAMSGLVDGPSADRCAVVVGVGWGASGFSEAQYAALTERGARGVSPLAVPIVMPNSIAAHLSLRYGITGPVLTVAAACAAGTMAIGEGLWLLRTGRADRVLVGGVDALVTASVSAMFNRMEAMSTRLAAPASSSRPFDEGRDGFVLGEGAGFLVLERQRGAVPDGLGRILGYATNADAHHLVVPSEHGAGAASCMRAALSDAGVEPAEVGHVNAHGTSTPRNDRAEAEAIRDVFGERGLPVTATKGRIGHLIGAAGAVEAIVTLLSVRHAVVPPTVNLHQPDAAATFDVRATPAPCPPGPALSNSFAFGGHNASLVVG